MVIPCSPRRWSWRGVCLALAIATWIGPVTSAFAAAVDFRQHDIRSVFRIEKSQNRNQVHYGLHLSESCVPQTAEPLYAYWHELERGPNVFLPLLPIEQTAYGIDSQEIQTRVVSAGRVLVHIRALPSREVAVESFRDSHGICQARAMMLINGQKSVLDSVFAKIGILTVESIQLRGQTFPGGQPVNELIRR